MGEETVNILLVEDNKAHVELIRNAFEFSGGNVSLQVAGSLEQARASLAQHPPDLIIADLILPDGRGTELLSVPTELRPSKPPFPVVVMTSYGSEEIAVEAMKAGVLDYVVKSAATLTDIPRIAERALREWAHFAERDAMETALRESQEKYRDLVENINDIIYAVDGDGILTYVSPVVEASLGYRPEEVIGRNFVAFVFPEDLPRIKGSFQSLLSGHSTANQYRMLTKSGQVRWMRTSSRPTMIENRIVGVRGVIADITEQLLAQEASQNYSKRVETLREIDRAILAAESPEAIARATLERIGPLVSCHGAGVMVFDWQADDAWVLGFLDVQGRRTEFEQRLPLAALTLLESYRRGECHIVDDIEALSQPSSPEQMVLAQGVRSYVLTPLIAGDALVGALVLGSTEPAHFASGRVEIAQEVAGSLAVAIQQARLREELQRRTAQVEASLHEREVMLQEIHHRVKNNLQVISSLLNLQSQQIEDERMLTVFADSRDRVQSMALVHETLYHSPNLDRVDLGEYISSLTSYLMRAHRGSTASVSLKLDVADVSLGIDSAVPCGLIINELVSNALKHAFLEGSEGEIYVGLHTEQTRLTLEVRDNGVGLHHSIDVHNPESLGLQLVNTLVQQLEGALRVDSKQGTTFRITFDAQEYRQRS